MQTRTTRDSIYYWEFLGVPEWVQVLLQKDRYLEMSQSVKNQNKP